MTVVDHRELHGAVDFGDLVSNARVHRTAYVSPDVFDAEMQRIFGRTWVYVGHASQVPRCGDYTTSWIGRQPVIVTRDQHEQVRVLFNRCSHRAASICQERAGHVGHFRCAYHGWTFRTDGTLISPTFASGYDAQDFAVEDFGLGAPPRVDSYRGFIFASLSPSGPTLQEHLGNARCYIDLFCDLSPTGEIEAGHAGAHHYGYAGNWKLQAENGVDGYHPNFVHQAFLDRGRGVAMQLFSGASLGRAADLGNGHALLDSRPTLGNLHERAFQSTPHGRAHVGALVERLGEDRAREVLRTNGGQGFNLLVFPNLLIIQVQIRVIHPRRHDLTEIDLYPTLLGGVEDAVNAERLRNHEAFYGPAGGGAPGDLEMFRRVQEGLAVESMEWLPLLRGLRRTEPGDHGAEWGHVTDEHPQRGFYRRWAEMMRR